jgi:hypothetical protein
VAEASTDPALAVAFSLSLPEDWFELDVRPATRDDSAKTLVDARVREQPELWEHRSALVRVLRRQARDAWEAGAIYCACFALVVDDAIIPGSLTVSVIPPPPAGSALDSIAELLPAREAREDGDPWMVRSMVDLPSAPRAVRSQGVADVRLSGGGALRTILMQTFIPLDSQRILLVAGASPALDLTEPLLELFDAVTSTLTLVPEDDGVAA